MGRQVAQATAADPATTPLGFVDALAESEECDGLPLYRDAGACLDSLEPAVVVDFTNAAWTPQLAKAALERGVNLVIGTTGLSSQFLEELGQEAAAKKLGVVVAPNFAIGAVLLMHFARQAARFFDHAEIIELHHAGKVDAPSGTAKTTAEQMVAAHGEPFARVEAETQIRAAHARGRSWWGDHPLRPAPRPSRAPGGAARRPRSDADPPPRQHRPRFVHARSAGGGQGGGGGGWPRPGPWNELFGLS